VKDMTRNTNSQCTQDERAPVEQDENQVIRSVELYEYLDLLRSVEVLLPTPVLCIIQGVGSLF